MADDNLGYPKIPQAFAPDDPKAKKAFDDGQHARWDAHKGVETGEYYRDPEGRGGLKDENGNEIGFPVRQSPGGGRKFILAPNDQQKGLFDGYVIKYPGGTGEDAHWHVYPYEDSNGLEAKAKALSTFGFDPSDHTKALDDITSLKPSDVQEKYRWLKEYELMNSGSGREAQAALSQFKIAKDYLDSARNMVATGKITADDLSYANQHRTDWQDFISQKLTGEDEARRERILAFKGDIDSAILAGSKVPGMRASGNIISTVADGFGKMIPEGLWGSIIQGGANAAANIAKGWTDEKMSFPELAANLNRADNVMTEAAIHQVNNDTDAVTGNIPYTQQDRDLVSGWQEQMKKELRTDGKVGIGYNDNVQDLSPNLLKIGVPLAQDIGAQGVEAGKTAIAAKPQAPEAAPLPKEEGAYAPPPAVGVPPAPKIKPAPIATPADTTAGASHAPPPIYGTSTSQAGGGLGKSNQPSNIGDLPIVQGIRDFWNLIRSPNRSTTPLSPPSQSPTPAPIAKPTPQPQRKLTPEEQKTIAQGLSVTQNDQLPNDAAMGAPLGSPDNPIQRQEHVDALPSGTPFYWADHKDPYVKV